MVVLWNETPTPIVMMDSVWLMFPVKQILSAMLNNIVIHVQT